MADFAEGSPTSYNGTGTSMDIDIMPDVIYDYAHTYLVTVRNNIEGCWQGIADAWEPLKLGWLGASADDAKKFNERLNAAQESLFGKEGGKTGILHQIRGAALMAATNYDHAEGYAIKLFDDFLHDLSAPSEPGAHPPKDAGGPISIDYDNGPGVRYDNREVIGQYLDSNGTLVLLYEGDEVPDNDNDHTIDTKWLENGDKPGVVKEKEGEIEIQAATWKDEKGNWHYVKTEGLGDTIPQPESTKK